MATRAALPPANVVRPLLKLTVPGLLNLAKRHTLTKYGGRCHGVLAVTALLFMVIPIVRIVFGVFPFNPNMWFGIGFATYYCFATPLLYQVYLSSICASAICLVQYFRKCSWMWRGGHHKASRAHAQADKPTSLFAAWHWTAASLILWHVYLYAACKAIYAMVNPSSHPARQATVDDAPCQQVALSQIASIGLARYMLQQYGQLMHEQLQDAALAIDVTGAHTILWVVSYRSATRLLLLPDRSLQTQGSDHYPCSVPCHGRQACSAQYVWQQRLWGSGCS